MNIFTIIEHSPMKTIFKHTLLDNKFQPKLPANEWPSIAIWILFLARSNIFV